MGSRSPSRPYALTDPLLWWHWVPPLLPSSKKGEKYLSSWAVFWVLPFANGISCSFLLRANTGERRCKMDGYFSAHLIWRFAIETRQSSQKKVTRGKAFIWMSLTTHEDRYSRNKIRNLIWLRSYMNISWLSAKLGRFLFMYIELHCSIFHAYIKKDSISQICH